MNREIDSHAVTFWMRLALVEKAALAISIHTTLSANFAGSRCSASSGFGAERQDRASSATLHPSYPLTRLGGAFFCTRLGESSRHDQLTTGIPKAAILRLG